MPPDVINLYNMVAAGPYLVLSDIGAYHGIIGEFLTEKPYESLRIYTALGLGFNWLVLCFLYLV